MSTSKYMTRICVLATIAALLITMLFCGGAVLGVPVQAAALGYEDRIFDTTKVHTIDIHIEDWDAFLSTAQSEEYTLCDVVIDGETVSNVGIRGKGNTSLSTVASMDSDRYSFKLEFDQYDSAQNYHGLDKLSLNNLIQDNTMMKDYLTYQMMHAFGVAAPLCSYVWITVNGEAWGLYLAVEAVEDSFLQRNYGSGYGDLYKPDSMDLGGGRGNGKDFRFEDALGNTGDSSMPAMPDGMQGGQMMPGMQGGFDPSQMGGMPPGGQSDPSQMGSMPGSFDPSQMGGMMPGGTGELPEQPTMPENFDPSQMQGMMPGGNMGMGASDTRLQYIDDQASSYSAIFDSAKTNVTAADQQRLIASLKSLSAGEKIESVVDVDAVIRYFVVHNYVVNADSYTGSMVHNYYLYEQDGQLSMIPWDYNLAFGTFQGGSASAMVCDDIDAPLSVTGSDRPMIDWIYASETYTSLYHTRFREFLDTVDPAAIIESARTLIAPYVEQDPTRFCTFEEFEKGADTLAAFCALRSQSVSDQLAGGDGTVDTSAITLSDMGTMSHGGSQMQPTTGTGGQWDPENSQPGQAESDRNSFPGRAPAATAQSTGQWLPLVIALAALAGGLIFAFKYKR